ncbi:MAG: TolC family outer membrane protein [Hydrogenovibrio sp.]|uniref:TolC family outer membrane protein n=1 Tax=Hydrogenovibrio sp. TaxID=2065821 RepID=UPI00287019F5|nr:TolC family outer membrane protein [Hydrogenovibrio sp.]MDR9499954.1 TolC family outer membrane protein [Hydrogenovibrio sp.]
MLKKTRAVALSTALACSPAFGQTPLQSAIKEAIEKNPEVQESWHEFLASEQARKGASSGYRPTVDLQTRYGQEWRDYGPDRTFDGADAQISFRQMLYDGFETRSEVERFSDLQLVRYHELLETAEQTAFEAFQAYTDVVRRRELRDLAKENLERHQEVFQQIVDGVNAGVVRTADLEQVSGRVALAETNLITEQSNLHDVTARFVRIVGRLPGQDITAYSPSETPAFDTLNATLNRAYENNPGFHAAIRNIHAAKSAVESSKSAMRPTLDLTADYSTQTYDDLGVDNGRSDARIGLELNYNLYRGGGDSAAIKEAYERTNVAKNQRDQECVNLRQEVQIAYNDIRAIDRRLPSLNQHRLSSERVVVAYRDQFEIGERTLLDVLDAENEAFQAKTAYVNALRDKEVAVASALTATGDWLTSVDVVRNGLPTLSDLGANELPIDGSTACPSMTSAVIDSDDDGVADHQDFCPGTPQGETVDAKGCPEQEEAERVFNANIGFATGSAVINARHDAELAEIAQFVKTNPNARVVIEGHASRTGSADFNLTLSEQRAEAAADIFIEDFGIDSDRLETIGYGFNRPIAEGNTPEAHAMNQRIEIRVSARKASSQNRGFQY